MFMLFLGRRMPRLGYFAAALVSLGFWLLNKPARRASMAFLARVKGDQGRWSLYRHSYRHVRMFGVLILDRSVALASADAGITVDSDHRTRLNRALAMERGLLIFTAHFGALEIAAPWLKTVVKPEKMHFVMYRDFNDSTEQFHHDQWKMLQGMNFINSIDPIAAGLQIMAAIRQRHCVGMRADRIMSGRMVQTPLLGQTVSLPAGPFTAAVVGNTAVVTAFTLRQGPRHYRMFVSEPRCYDIGAGFSREQLIQKAAEDYAADLEILLRQYPYQWGNFYDFWSKPGGRPDTPSTSEETATPAT